MFGIKSKCLRKREKRDFLYYERIAINRARGRRRKIRAQQHNQKISEESVEESKLDFDLNFGFHFAVGFGSCYAECEVPAEECRFNIKQKQEYFLSLSYPAGLVPKDLLDSLECPTLKTFLEKNPDILRREVGYYRHYIAKQEKVIPGMISLNKAYSEFRSQFNAIIEGFMRRHCNHFCPERKECGIRSSMDRESRYAT